jgi:hypothetical protein
MWSIHKKPYRLVTYCRRWETWEARKLMDWIADYCNTLVPSNSIVEWTLSEPRYSGCLPNGEWVAAKPHVGFLPDEMVSGSNISHVMAYVSVDKVTGRQHLQVAFEMRDSGDDFSILRLCSALVLGDPNEAWLLAQRIAEVLEDILMHDAIPAMVDMFRKLPAPKGTAASSQVIATVSREGGAASVTLEDGTEVDHVDFGNQDPANTQAAAWCSDWAKVLRHANYSVRTGVLATAPDLAA